jgi:uncharacterized membrane protein
LKVRSVAWMPLGSSVLLLASVPAVGIFASAGPDYSAGWSFVAGSDAPVDINRLLVLDGGRLWATCAHGGVWSGIVAPQPQSSADAAQVREKKKKRKKNIIHSFMNTYIPSRIPLFPLLIFSSFPPSHFLLFFPLLIFSSFFFLWLHVLMKNNQVLPGCLGHCWSAFGAGGCVQWHRG